MTRQQLIEKLAKQQSPYEGYEPHFNEGFHAACNLLSPLIPEWISVTDRLPENGEYVVCLWHEKLERLPLISIDMLVDQEGYRIASITHWLPLPLPPGTDPLQSLIKK